MANNFIPVRLEYSGGSSPTGWAEYQTGETAVLPGNLNFTGDGRRITGSMSGAVADRLSFQTSATNGDTNFQIIPSGTQVNSSYNCWGSSDLGNAAFGQFRVDGAGGYVKIMASRIGSATFPYMFFDVGGAERVRVDTGGTMMVGTTSASPITANVPGVAIQGANSTLVIRSGAGLPTMTLGVQGSGGTGTFAGFFYGPSTGVGSITTNGTTTAYNTSSDYRLKDNVQPLNAVEATDRIMAFEPVTWTWKSDSSFGKGFIAHKNQAVDPMTATGTKDQMERVGSIVLADGTVVAESVREPEDLSIYGEGATWELTEVRAVYQGRDDSKMIPDMIAMMQRQERRIAELETQLQQALALLQPA